MKYNKDKIKLHTTSKKDKEEWFKKFDELIALKRLRSEEEAENVICSKSLYWISNYFLTFKDQMEWVEMGIMFYKEVGQSTLTRIKIS